MCAGLARQPLRLRSTHALALGRLPGVGHLGEEVAHEGLQRQRARPCLGQLARHALVADRAQLRRAADAALQV
jgi:hypothetical protein